MKKFYKLIKKPFALTKVFIERNNKFLDTTFLALGTIVVVYTAIVFDTKQAEMREREFQIMEQEKNVLERQTEIMGAQNEIALKEKELLNEQLAIAKRQVYYTELETKPFFQVTQPTTYGGKKAKVDTIFIKNLGTPVHGLMIYPRAFIRIEYNHGGIAKGTDVLMKNYFGRIVKKVDEVGVPSTVKGDNYLKGQDLLREIIKVAKEEFSHELILKSLKIYGLVKLEYKNKDNNFQELQQEYYLVDRNSNGIPYSKENGDERFETKYDNLLDFETATAKQIIELVIDEK